MDLCLPLWTHTFTNTTFNIHKHNLNISNPGYITMSHSDVLMRGPGEPMAVNVSMQCLEMALSPLTMPAGRLRRHRQRQRQRWTRACTCHLS